MAQWLGRMRCDSGETSSNPTIALFLVSENKKVLSSEVLYCKLYGDWQNISEFPSR